MDECLCGRWHSENVTTEYLIWNAHSQVGARVEWCQFSSWSLCAYYATLVRGEAVWSDVDPEWCLVSEEALWSAHAMLTWLPSVFVFMSLQNTARLPSYWWLCVTNGHLVTGGADSTSKQKLFSNMWLSLECLSFGVVVPEVMNLDVLVHQLCLTDYGPSKLCLCNY